MRISSMLLLAAALGAAGCERSGENAPAAEAHSHGGAAHAHAPENGQEHELKTAQITVWTNGYEIFAEHQPPIAGEPARFITHVSELGTGTPRSSGPVKFILRKGGAAFEHPQAAPARPGIYLPTITFPSEGDWRASVILPGETNTSIDLGVITVFPNREAAAHAEYPEAPEGIPFLKEQQWRIRARTEEAARQTLVERMALHAAVVPGRRGRANVSSPVAGRLAAEGLARLGEAVKAGAVLGWIEPSFNEFTAKLIEAESEAVRAKAALEQAETAFDRTQALFEQQAKSRRELQEAEVAFRAAQAAYNSATRIQRLYNAAGATFQEGALRIALKAPFAGVVDKIGAGIGQRVEPGEPLFTIINPASVHVRAHLPETKLGAIQPELPAVFQITTERGPAAITNGLNFLALGREIDPGTRTLPVTYELNNTEHPLPMGRIGMLLVPAGKSFEALAIPSRAIVEEEGLPIAFVQLTGETFQKRDLKLGVRDGAWTEVLSGISEGERIVTDGAYALLLSTKAGTIPAHGHAR